MAVIPENEGTGVDPDQGIHIKIKHRSNWDSLRDMALLYKRKGKSETLHGY